MSYLDGTDDVFDSRELIERIEELETEIGDNTAPDDYVMEREELSALLAFRDEVGERDMLDGITFIRDDYFPDYAEELAEDIGAIDRNAGWPLPHIDWEAAADALKIDYTSYELYGETYWGRA